MYRTVKIIFIMFAACFLAGCRSAKPTSKYETVADSLTMTSEAFAIESGDSLSILVDTRSGEYDALEFVDGGGVISVFADGTLSLSGVVAVKSSRQKATMSLEELKIRHVQSLSNDRLVSKKESSSFIERKEETPSDTLGWKVKYAVAIFIILIIIIGIARFRRNIL